MPLALSTHIDVLRRKASDVEQGVPDDLADQKLSVQILKTNIKMFVQNWIVK